MFSDLFDPALKLRLCQNIETFLSRSFTEVNDVKLVGTLINDSFTLQSGTKALTIKTIDTPTKQYVRYRVYFFIVHFLIFLDNFTFQFKP